jgi:hypothetical protein
MESCFVTDEEGSQPQVPAALEFFTPSKDGSPELKCFLAPPLGYKLLLPASFLHDGELGETVSWSQHDTNGLPTGAMIYVNWVWLPEPAAEVQFEMNLQGVRMQMASPICDYHDLRVFDRSYAWDGPAFWYKEKDKDDPAGIHRWIVRAFGNQSQYTLGLTGNHGQFARLAPLYEQVVRSFARAPLAR